MDIIELIRRIFGFVEVDEKKYWKVKIENGHRKRTQRDTRKQQ
jgi:hypothetical protein